MSALSLDPCEGFNLSGDYFRPGDFSTSAIVTDSGGTRWLCRVFAEQTWNPPNNCFVKFGGGAGGLNLAFDGPVWLDVWTFNGQQFEYGGYLEEIEYTYYFDSTPLRFRALGVRAAPYMGGVKIEGLNSANQWTFHEYGAQGELYGAVSEPFVFGGRRQSFVSWWSRGHSELVYGPQCYAIVPGIFADDIRRNTTRISSPSRSDSTRSIAPEVSAGFHSNAATNISVR